MTSLMNSLGRVTVKTLFAAAQRNADADGTGVDVSDLEGTAILLVDLNNISGATPTADLKLQECDTVGGTYTDLGATGSKVAAVAATQVGAASSRQRIEFEVQATKKFVRAVLDVGDTSPVYGVAAYIIGQAKY